MPGEGEAARASACAPAYRRYGTGEMPSSELCKPLAGT